MNNYEIMILNNRLVPNPDSHPLDEDFIKYCEKQIDVLNSFKNSIDSLVKIVNFQSIDCTDKTTYASKHKTITKYEYINETILRLINEKVKYLKENVNLTLELKKF
jgi:hypothetical protein